MFKQKYVGGSASHIFFYLSSFLIQYYMLSIVILSKIVYPEPLPAGEAGVEGKNLYS